MLDLLSTWNSGKWLNVDHCSLRSTVNRSIQHFAWIVKIVVFLQSYVTKRLRHQTDHVDRLYDEHWLATEAPMIRRPV